jgi:ribosomal protein S18 acetylase RimI-like enzyme
MTADVLIRNLAPEDVHSVWQLGSQAFDWPSERIIWDEAVVSGFIDRARELSFVAIHDYQIIGFILCRSKNELGYVGWIAVDTHWRNQKIGGRLMDRAILAMRAAGIDHISAFVRDDHAAGRLFEKCGFCDIGLRKLDLVLQLTRTPTALK